MYIKKLQLFKVKLTNVLLKRETLKIEMKKKNVYFLYTCGLPRFEGEEADGEVVVEERVEHV